MTVMVRPKVVRAPAPREGRPTAHDPKRLPSTDPQCSDTPFDAEQWPRDLAGVAAMDPRLDASFHEHPEW